jgi:hypothetical protein
MPLCYNHFIKGQILKCNREKEYESSSSVWCYFWSSPTTGMQTYDFAPATDLNRFNGYNSVTMLILFLNANTTVFSRGIGYVIRCPINTRQRANSSTLSIWVLPIMEHLQSPYYSTSWYGLKFNRKPYPSSLNVAHFINENLYNPVSNPTNTLSGTYYLWSHNTRLSGNDFSSDDYYTCNLSGPTGFTLSETNTPPNGFIASGQGFCWKSNCRKSKFDNTRETKTILILQNWSKNVAELET